MKDEYSESVTINRANLMDLPNVLVLLYKCNLPKEGLANHLSRTLVARSGDRVVGCSPLELYEECALLRSVAVEPSFRGHGLALRLTRAALDLAKHHQVTTVYLLTETASMLFSKLGFEEVSRSDVPKEVQGSIEFVSLCPDTATVMKISLKER